MRSSLVSAHGQPLGTLAVDDRLVFHIHSNGTVWLHAERGTQQLLFSGDVRESACTALGRVNIAEYLRGVSAFTGLAFEEFTQSDDVAVYRVTA